MSSKEENILYSSEKRKEGLRLILKLYEDYLTFKHFTEWAKLPLKGL